MADFDLAVIGGGINGAAIARDAAGRGFKVVLLEQGDLASGTSSASSKLIHGGLRYLERGAFRLVREALSERDILLRAAPHIIRPMRFVLPPQGGRRPGWLVRLGLFVYDHLGGRTTLPGTRVLDLTNHMRGAPLRRRFTVGFEYSDCWVDDSRFVVLTALDAAERGAIIRTRTRCTRAERGAEWTLVLNARGRRDAVTAKALVNAAGPWLNPVAETVVRTTQRHGVRLVKGSHIVVPRLFAGDAGYVLTAADERIVFALPFEQHYTLIGTTDHDFVGDPAICTPDAAEVDYLCAAANIYFRETINSGDVVWSYSGVRALYDDGAARTSDVTRDYVLGLDQRPGEAALLTVYGGKITTARRVAEAALAKLSPAIGTRAKWTRNAALPGGDFAVADFHDQVERAMSRWPFLLPERAGRMVAAYGTRIAKVLDGVTTPAGLGVSFGDDLTAAEVRYLMRCEWAETADDVLWRRSKLGLRVTRGETEALARFMAQSVGAA